MDDRVHQANCRLQFSLQGHRIFLLWIQSWLLSGCTSETQALSIMLMTAVCHIRILPRKFCPCQVCNNSSSASKIGRSVFVSEQGQKFHLTRYCRTFENLPVTEYRMCSACGTAGDTMRGSMLRMRNTPSSFSSATELS